VSPGMAHPLDDLAVYALDALDEPERALVDAHLAGCTACRAELDQHRTTLSHLTTPEEPPPELWDRIARQTAATPPRIAQATEPAPAPGPRPLNPAGDHMAPVVPLHRAREGPTGGDWAPRHRAAGPPRGRSGWLTAVAAIAVVLAGIAGVTVWSQRAGDEPATVAELAAAAADDPDATVVPLTPTSGGDETSARIVTTGEPTGYVLLDNLPRLDEGHSYQLWRVDDPNVPVSLGVLGDGSTEAAAIAVPEGTTSFAISDEPVPGGVPAPTGPIVAQGTSS
jgi:anti-sigma-K factor RskA